MENETILNYITTSEWWDTDFTLIPIIKKIPNVKINLIVIISCKESKYSISEINQYCERNELRLTTIMRTHKIRHFSNMFVALNVFRAINRPKHWCVYYVYSIDPYLNLLLMLLKNKLIISFHNYIEHGRKKKLSIETLYKKIVIDLCHYFHFHSVGQRKIFSTDYPNKKSFVTTMPLKDYGIYTGPLVKSKRTELLFFGYIRDYKNLELLIRSVEELKGSNVRLTIAGNCKEFTKYNKLIKNEYLFNKQIRFIQNDEVPYYFSTAHFLVLPYNDSTQSGPLLIAMNYNLPIIASDIAPFNTIVKNNVNGYLFNPSISGSLTNAISGVCRLTEDDYTLIKSNFNNSIKEYQKSVELNHKVFEEFIRVVSSCE